MPELPEVETIVRRLARRLPGRTIVRADVRRPNVVRGSPRKLERALEGATIESVGRRGKFLVFRLADGRVWWSHLRMTGQWRVEGPQGDGARRSRRGRVARESARPDDDPYARAVFDLDDGSRLTFVDVRTLGEMEVLTARGWARREAAMGVEPLSSEFTPDLLSDLLATSRRPVKEFLLDQAKIAGIGNIYASEALWRARISPRRRARNVGSVRAKALHAAIVGVLKDAIRKAGTTLGETSQDYVDSDGVPGGFAEFLAAYDREGEPCPRCGTPIRRIVQGQRSTYYCPTCQR
ncbi:MAG TPA: bifunctional DNA-formamidopyrimidine glycosylase/DNA-(apurinic or apyrimidinic site) lyase [Gemmatimonadota bacterium]|nr:bifunctional DNA-formamidopyrimidine glycosylase/DNA-(apurinic or apyrimidinic site) lyase [Gemmatimonadota bacterium]